MSGPCADCGGPDYQTLLARIAEMEAENERVVEELGKAEHMLLRYVLAEIARALGDSDKEAQLEADLKHEKESGTIANEQWALWMGKARGLLKDLEQAEAERIKWEWVARHADRPSLMDRPNLCERGETAIAFILARYQPSEGGQ